MKKRYGPGRPVKTETLDLMEKIRVEIAKAKQIPNSLLADNLGIKTLKCSVLAKRLESEGLISIDKSLGYLNYTYKTKS
jgi:ribosomal protein S25